MTELLCVAMVIQVIRYSRQPLVGVDIAVIDDSDNLHLVLCNHQISIFKAITIRSKATVPLSLTGFLFPARHSLCADVLTLNFRNSGEDGDHQLA